MFIFENIIAYKKALILVNEVYKVTQLLPKQETFALTDQLRRASFSIVLNIAEGSSRTRKEFRRFLDFARGSCFECIAIITIAENQSYLSHTSFSSLYNKIEELTKIIQGLKNSLH